MRQLATAPDGTGYEIRPCWLVVKEDEPPRDAAMLVEDGIEIGSDGKRRPFETFAAARSAAWERFVERSKAVGIDEYHSANGRIGLLIWRTES